MQGTYIERADGRDSYNNYYYRCDSSSTAVQYNNNNNNISYNYCNNARMYMYDIIIITCIDIF